MKNVTLIQKEIKPKVEPSISVECPYCKVSTVINRLLTQPACKHFENFVLFEKCGELFSEIEDPSKEVVMCEAKFRSPESKNHGIKKVKTGEIVITEDGIELMVDGKSEGFLSPDEFDEMLFDDEEEDIDIIRG